MNVKTRSSMTLNWSYSRLTMNSDGASICVISARANGSKVFEIHQYPEDKWYANAKDDALVFLIEELGNARVFELLHESVQPRPHTLGELIEFFRDAVHKRNYHQTYNEPLSAVSIHTITNSPEGCCRCAVQAPKRTIFSITDKEYGFHYATLRVDEKNHQKIVGFDEGLKALVREVGLWESLKCLRAYSDIIENRRDVTILLKAWKKNNDQLRGKR